MSKETLQRIENKIDVIDERLIKVMEKTSHQEADISSLKKAHARSWQIAVSVILFIGGVLYNYLNK
jgi:hypothetical protein